MVPVEVFDELTSDRARSLSQAAGSVCAEDLTVGADVQLMDDPARSQDPRARRAPATTPPLMATITGETGHVIDVDDDLVEDAGKQPRRRRRHQRRCRLADGALGRREAAPSTVSSPRSVPSRSPLPGWSSSLPADAWLPPCGWLVPPPAASSSKGVALLEGTLDLIAHHRARQSPTVTNRAAGHPKNTVDHGVMDVLNRFTTCRNSVINKRVPDAGHRRSPWVETRPALGLSAPRVPPEGPHPSSNVPRTDGQSRQRDGRVHALRGIGDDVRSIIDLTGTGEVTLQTHQDNAHAPK
jgi:hypothetical protein